MTTYDKLVAAFSRAMFDTHMVSARIMLGLSELVWAILLWWPGESFDRPSYKVMSYVMPEDCWGWIFLLTCFMQFSIITKGEFHSREARNFAAFNAVLWVFVAVSIICSVYPPPAAISGEIVLAITASWIWFRPFLMCKWIINARNKM